MTDINSHYTQNPCCGHFECYRENWRNPLIDHYRSVALATLRSPSSARGRALTKSKSECSVVVGGGVALLPSPYTTPSNIWRGIPRSSKSGPAFRVVIGTGNCRQRTAELSGESGDEYTISPSNNVIRHFISLI